MDRDSSWQSLGAFIRMPERQDLDIDCTAVGISTLGDAAVQIKDILYLAILVSQWLCGLATVTSVSRMIFAFARDGGLPAQGTGALTPDDLTKSVLVTPLSKSDWQLRGLFDRQRVLDHVVL